MTLQHTRSGVESALINLHRDQFYCIEYIGEHRRENYFRRIRAAFIGGAPLIIRADYCDDWIVRSRNKIPLELYRSRPGLVAEADAIIERPVEELGNAAMKTLEEIGRVIPLDIFGMDFDVDDGGHVLFFEANASMNLFSNAPDEFPYPARAEKALKEALEGMLDSRAR